MTNILSKEDYKILNKIMFDHLDHNERNQLLEELIQRNAPNWAVCPVCRIDDFSHIENCPIRYERVYSNDR